MSIKEVYEDLAAQSKKQMPAEPTNRQILDRQHADLMHERKKHEKRDAWAKHIELFEELQSLGIIGALEELTGERLEITKDPDGYKSAKIDRPWRHKISQANMPVWESIIDLQSRYSFALLDPKLQDDTETWTEEAGIILGHPTITPNFTHIITGVTIGFNPDKTFTVRGAELEFKGPLPEDKTARLKTVELAVAKALHNPLSK